MSSVNGAKITFTGPFQKDSRSTCKNAAKHVIGDKPYFFGHYQISYTDPQQAIQYCEAYFGLYRDWDQQTTAEDITDVHCTQPGVIMTAAYDPSGSGEKTVINIQENSSVGQLRNNNLNLYFHATDKVKATSFFANKPFDLKELYVTERQTLDTQPPSMHVKSCGQAVNPTDNKTYDTCVTIGVNNVGRHKTQDTNASNVFYEKIQLSLRWLSC